MAEKTAAFDDELLKKTLAEVTRHYDDLVASRGAAAGASVEAEALQELSAMIEELNVASEELRVQNQALRDAYYEVETQRARYEELFTLVPDAYIVTDDHGVIQEANQAAEFMLTMSA